jgi:hypothetical protein
MTRAAALPALDPILRRAESFCGPSGFALDLTRVVRHGPGSTHRDFDEAAP